MPILFLCLTLVLNLFAPAAALASQSPPPAPRLSAAAYILIDADSGQTLAANHARERREPASLTKMMTALVALERSKLESTVTVSTGAAHVGGQMVGLSPGQKLELWVALYGMLFLSGNDAARAVAETVGGSVDSFSGLMNQKAHEIGADSTHFVNPHGLPAPNHYSTAYDLALIARRAMQEPTFARIVGRTSRVLPWGRGTKSLANINKFMYRYSGAKGIKTGYTGAAGYCLAAAATHGKRTLIAVLLGCTSSEARWQDAINLMDYGFANYERLAAVGSGPARAGNGVAHVVVRGETLWGLARRLGTDVEHILQLNPGLDPDHIKAGEEIYLPWAMGG